MSFSKIIAKLKLNNYDIVPISLYIASIAIAFMQSREVAYIYIHNKANVTYNPYLFTLYILLPALAFMTSTTSGLIKVPNSKIKYMSFSYICLAFIIFGMFTQYSNELAWRFIMSAASKMEGVPPEILDNALRAATFYLPLTLTTCFSLLYIRMLSERDAGIWIPQLSFKFYSKPSIPMGPMTCEMPICTDTKTGKVIVTPEARRMEATLIQGATGTGKTATLLLPMGAVDMERKYFFKELAKEQGYKSLEKGYAYVDAPLSSDELNRNFSLNYLKPYKGKEELFENEVKELIKYKDSATGEILYSDLGIGAIDPDGEYVSIFKNITHNFGIDCTIVDPMDENSVGINPFIGPDPAKIASIISNVLKGMYESENPVDNNLFFAQVTQQAIENISILLKVVYPRMHDGLLPNLIDMLRMLHNYDLVEEMCEELKRDPQLALEYKILIKYFEKNFYKPPLNDRGIPIPGGVGSGRRVTEQFLYGATTQLDNLLRQKDVKRVLCSRSNNIDFDDILVKGKCLTVCTRRGPLGGLLSKAFGMFFILSFQDAILRRPGDEKTRIPFFLYIDEFPDFVNKETETCFTLFRKYRCGLVVAIQNLSQLERTKSMKYYKKVVLANTKTQLIFGDTNVEDTLYWADAFGKELQNFYSFGVGGGPDKYSESNGQTVGWDHAHPPPSIQFQDFKGLKYKTKDGNGNTIYGDGKTNFLEPKYMEEHPVKFYDFDKFRINPLYTVPETETEPASQYESIFTPFEQVETGEKPDTTPPLRVQPVHEHEEPSIDFGENIASDLKDDNISAEEMNALKELITEIHTDEEAEEILEEKPVHWEEPSVEIGTSLREVQHTPEIIDVKVEEEDNLEIPDVLDKSGKIKIEVNHK